MLIGIATLALVWVGGDFVYSRVVLRHVKDWERSIERDTDGVRAGCQDYTVGEGSTALLWIHGFNDCPAAWQSLAPELAARGFTCRVMRLPGFALPTEEYARTTRERWRAAVAREVEKLARTHDRVGIVAHSLGGAIAVDHVLGHPRSVEGIALLAPLIRVSGERSPLVRPRHWHSFGTRTLFFTSVLETPFPVDAISPEAVAYDKRTRFTPREVLDELYALIDEIDGRGDDVCVPVLLALGNHDEVIDGAAAERFFESCPDPGKRLVRLDEAGHMLPLDEGRELLADEIERFFAVVD
jgi:carboxylesterase